MKNISYHYRIDCKWCGWNNHGTIPVLAKDGASQTRCDHCGKFMFELHAKEQEE